MNKDLIVKKIKAYAVHPLFIVSLICVIPFLFVWLRGRLFYDFDMTFITAPIEDMFAHYQRQGSLPLWAPELQGGYPLIAISHLGFFYPLHVVLRQFLPGVITLNISLFLHTILGTIGTYLLLRQEGFKKQSSTLGTFVFTGTGFFVGRFYLTNVFLPWSWMPICLWLLGNWLKKKNYLSLLGLSVAIALQVLLGQPQAALISVIALAIYGFAHFTDGFKKTLSGIPLLIPAAILTLLLSLAQFGPTLSIVPYSDRSDAMQPKELYEFNFPVYHLVSWVLPHTFGYHENYIGAKNETELSSWVGTTLLLFILCGLFSLKKMPKRPLIFSTLLLIVSVLMVSGEHSPLYRYLVEHHWLDSLAIPARWLLLLFMSLSFFAAHGVEYLLSISQKARLKIILLAVITIFLTLFFAWKNIPTEIRPQAKINVLSVPFRSLVPFIALAITAFFALRVKEKQTLLFVFVASIELLAPNLTRNVSVPFSQPFEKAQAENILKAGSASGDRIFSQRDLSTTQEARPSFIQLKRLSNNFQIKQNFKSYGDQLRGINLDIRWGKLASFDFPINLELRDLTTNEKRSVTVAVKNIKDGSGVDILLSKPFSNCASHDFEIVITSSESKLGPWIMISKYPSSNKDDYLPGGKLQICEQGQCNTPEIKNISDPDIALIPLYPETNRIRLAQQMLAPHIAASKDIPSTQWLGALQLREIKRYLYEIGDQNENAVDYNPFIKEKRQLVNRLGIGYFIGSYTKNRTIDLENTTLLQEQFFENQIVRLYKNEEVRPRTEFIKNATSVHHPDDARAVLFDAKSAEDPVPVEDDNALEKITLNTGNAKIETYKPTEITIDTENSSTGLLILRDTYYPDWHAYIDGKETRIYPTEWIFRGIIVPAGKHEIKFVYTPNSTTKYLLISGVSWLLLIISTSVYFFRKAHSKTKPSI